MACFLAVIVVVSSGIFLFDFLHRLLCIFLMKWVCILFLCVFPMCVWPRVLLLRIYGCMLVPFLFSVHSMGICGCLVVDELIFLCGIEGGL